MITVMLVDDHPLLRDGVRTMLEAGPSVRVVAETGSGLEAIELAVEHRPDVAIVDLKLADLSGFEVIRQILEGSPHTRPVVLTAYAELHLAARAFGLGARAFVAKEETADCLVNAIDAVMSGRRLVSAPLHLRAIDDYLAGSVDQTVPAYETLTPREREVFELVVQGHTSTQIAGRLAISPRTVEGHRAQVQHKLGVEGTADLVRFAYEYGLLPEDGRRLGTPN